MSQAGMIPNKAHRSEDGAAAADGTSNGSLVRCGSADGSAPKLGLARENDRVRALENKVRLVIVSYFVS